MRKIGSATIHSVGHIARLQRIQDNDVEFVDTPDMLSELREDEEGLVLSMRAVHALWDEAGDVATASLLETWIRDSAASGSCLNRRVAEGFSDCETKTHLRKCSRKRNWRLPAVRMGNRGR